MSFTYSEKGKALNMILLLFLTSGILHIVEGTEPAVEISYEEVAARPYTATLYSITCSVTHMPVNSNLWLSMNSSAGGYVENFTGESNRRFWYTVRYDSDSSVTVVFNRFNPHYEGQYTCVVRENTDDDPLEWSSKSVYLKLLFLNDGSALQLQCVASGVPEPKVEWKKKGNDNYVIEKLNELMEILPTKSEIYFGTSYNNYVRFKPLLDGNGYQHGGLIFVVNGLPPPTVTWWKETEIGRQRIIRESTSTHRFLIYEGFFSYPETETDHRLIIEAPTQFQLGTYVAKAENSLGVAELNFTINAAETTYTIQR
ncbi:unnamed protein product [Mytilus edulis]|uniref:Ig-like domain-containing protein n=1 Tax=Mytilus edulis TaxID=6550 RepID=A0A8S3PZF9_MYTED|nr:unnamed protein product [Mytilus edulis]